MHLRDSSTAQIMRRASTGPHALMVRRALAPYVPDRGSTFSGHPSRSRRTQYLGAVSTTQSIASGISRGSAAGAAVGSVVPIFGTAIGAIIGAAVGWADAAFNRQDPEVQNWDQATQMAAAQGPETILNVMNKYLVLAGLFDLEPHQIKGNIPIYRKYGKMGEGKFVTDMVNLVYNAAQAGQISPNDNAQTVFARIVQPWIDSFGFGAMSDSNGDTINYLLMGMLAEYFAGLNKRWFARGGDYPFGGLPPFSLPQAVSPTSSATPSPVVAPASSQAAPAQPVGELQRYLNGALPQNGTPVNYALGPDGKFLSIPVGGMFMGRQPDGSWIIQYATGEYVLSGGQLVPYQTAQIQSGLPAAISQPAPATQLGPPAGTPQITLTPDPGYVTAQPPPQIQYVSSGGGGGYYPPTPQYAPAQPAQSVSTQEMLLLGGGALLLVLLLTRRGSSAAGGI